MPLGQASVGDTGLVAIQNDTEANASMLLESAITEVLEFGTDMKNVWDMMHICVVVSKLPVKKTNIPKPKSSNKFIDLRRVPKMTVNYK